MFYIYLLLDSLVQAPQGNEAEGRQGPTADQIRDINQLLRGQVPSGQSMPQVLQIPLGAAIPFPFINQVRLIAFSSSIICELPSDCTAYVFFEQPIPDSLHTLSEFMNRMELTLSQNGDSYRYCSIRYTMLSLHLNSNMG